MITEFIDYGVATVLVGPLSFILWRINQFRSARRRGKTPHIFEPHIRKDMQYGKRVMKWCDICQQGPKAFIHTNRKSSDAAEGNYLDYKELGKLEQADIRYRFANDPEWVQVFGHEYDPITFLFIPQSHNGECGGPHDSCERCNYEDDLAKRKDKEEMAEVRAKLAQQDKANRKLTAEELKGYESILWDIWNTMPGPEEAHEEFIDIRSDIGMLKNASLRESILALDVFKRLDYCLIEKKDYPLTWHRREEAWVNQKKRVADRKRYY